MIHMKKLFNKLKPKKKFAAFLTTLTLFPSLGATRVQPRMSALRSFRLTMTSICSFIRTRENI